MSHLSPDSDIEAQPSRLQPALSRKSISFSSLPTRNDIDSDSSKSFPFPSVEKTPCPKSPFPWEQKGYPALATIMSEEPSFMVFRRFGRLNALNLLALQAELLGLEHEYQQQLRADDMSQTSNEARGLSTDMWKMTKAEGPSARQREILEQIRPKLAAYNAALAANAAVDKLPGPQQGDMDNLRGWLASPDGGDNFMARGRPDPAAPEAHTYDELWRDDFVSLRPDSGGEAQLAKVLNPVLLRWYHRHVEWRLRPDRRRFAQGRGGSRDYARAYLDERDRFFGAVDTFMSVAATLLASLMPVVAVLILYFIRNVVVRIGATIAMTVVFGLVLATCTNSSLKEIFSATIAFAGLEVIFIGTNGVS